VHAVTRVEDVDGLDKGEGSGYVSRQYPIAMKDVKDADLGVGEAGVLLRVDVDEVSLHPQT
jgi:hypothetical protein